MFVIKGNYPERKFDEYVATDPSMRVKSDQSYIVRDLSRADKFSSYEEADKYLDEYGLRDRYWKIVEIE